MHNKRRIAITGIGPLSSGGSGVDEVWRSIERGDTGLSKERYQIGDEFLGEYFIHKVSHFNLDSYGINTQLLNEMRSWKEGVEIEDLKYFLAVSKMAIDNSGLVFSDADSYRTGLVLAHENMGLDHFYWAIATEFADIVRDVSATNSKAKLLDLFYKHFRKTGYELQTFMTLFHVAKAMNIHGFSLFINNACASGLYALEVAADAIRQGRCDRMVVAAVDRPSIFKQKWFDEIGMYAKDGRIKPFAKNRNGFVLGEGGAAIVLEDFDLAIARKARIYASYLGGGFSLEGWKVTYPDIVNKPYRRAVTDALASSGINASDVDLVVPHGVGSTVTDAYEADVIRGVFGSGDDAPFVTALKPYIGHVLGATALLETAISLIALSKGFIPLTLNCEKIDEGLMLNIARESKPFGVIKILMKTACGFAGFDGVCVFEGLGERCG